jgi:hypothetical protein
MVGDDGWGWLCCAGVLRRVVRFPVRTNKPQVQAGSQRASELATVLVSYSSVILLTSLFYKRKL